MPQPNPPQPLMSISQVAATLNVSTKTVRRMIGEQELHHHRVGRVIRVSPEDLRAYINSTRE
jgi:excisionase family DNA binding protein